MTTINCSLNCVHQEDGKCHLENTSVNRLSASSECIFFKERPAKERFFNRNNQS